MEPYSSAMDDAGTILVVEDNDALRTGLAVNLAKRGYRVHVAADGAEALKSAFAVRPDLVVLDLVLPGTSGLDVLAELRRRDRDIPVLILSARARTEDKVEGLERGADDYLAKPFELEELLARVAAVLRRGTRRRDREVLWVGGLKIDLERRRVFLDGREVELRGRELDVLSLLAASPGRPRTRQEILDEVWGWDYDGSPRTVDNFILSLRRKIEIDPARPRRLLTERGVGYKLAEDPTSSVDR